MIQGSSVHKASSSAEEISAQRLTTVAAVAMQQLGQERAQKGGGATHVHSFFSL